MFQHLSENLARDPAHEADEPTRGPSSSSTDRREKQDNVEDKRLHRNAPSLRARLPPGRSGRLPCTASPRSGRCGSFFSRGFLGRRLIVLRAVAEERDVVGNDTELRSRGQKIAAEIIGVNLFKYKLLSFAVSSFYAGVAGALYTYYLRIANYENFAPTK